MSRVREFRAWNGKEMYACDPYDMGPILAGDTDDILVEYIGMNDRNGKKIFEGDIVKFDDRVIGGCTGIGEVYFETDYTLVQSPSFVLWCKAGGENHDGRILSGGYRPMPLGAEIIGNKFENPELLEGKDD